ncbi:MAG: sulfite exporter TauE/SafE family protein [Pelagibacterium sp.]|uniref:sulfite exporter TauE/SafE family protein n=1 Tax=Pelagibacterium sp. TaxID=1967288 RepID=UPI0032EF4F60
METYLLIVLSGAAVAGFVQGLAGFAFALASLSIWAWAVDPALAAPMAVFGSLVGQLVTLPIVGRHFNFRGMLPFVAGGVLGVPLGIFLLSVLDPQGFKLALGIFMIVYCPIMLFVPAGFKVDFGGDWANAIAGWLGGIFGGLGGMSGPIPTLWCTLRGMDKDSQRGVMQGFNIAMHITTMVGYFLAGTIITNETWQHFGLVAIALVLPALLGAMLFKRLHTRAFRRIVLALLFVSGLVLTISSAPALLP